MGTVLASAIMDVAAQMLHDEQENIATNPIFAEQNTVRWTRSWMFSGINYGQREICLLKPSAYTVAASVRLAAGTYQDLPAAATGLIKISHNMGTDGATPGRLITKVDLEKLGAYNPYFTALPTRSEVRHYAYDPKSPRQFVVIPPQPATSRGYVYMIYPSMPADIATPPGIEPDYDVAITLGDEYVNALTYYLLYWCYTKDADFSPSARERAVAWYNVFAENVLQKQRGEAQMIDPNAAQHEVAE